MTSRPEILAAARRVIDRDGWEKLTIRRLGLELGIGATTLYHHVHGRQDLLLLLLDEHLGQLPRPALPDQPRARIVAGATALHTAAADWPWLTEVVSADGFVGLLDESALWPVEAIVSGAVEQGLTGSEAVDLFRCLWYYTIGEVLVRSRTATARADDRHLTHRAEMANLDSPRLPQLAAVRHEWQGLAARDIYPEGLEAFVDGLLARAGSRRRQGPSGAG